jgi:hypothetical protein
MRIIGRRGFLCGLGAIFGLGTPAVAKPWRGPARHVDYDWSRGLSYDLRCPIDVGLTHDTFTETHRLADDAMADNFKATTLSLVGRYNDAPFRGFEAGECVLTSVAYLQGGPITFSFAAGLDLESRKPGDFSLLRIGA